MDFTQIRYEVADNVLTITLNRPERLNAWTAVMQGELLEAFDLADADDAVRAVVVTGAGRGFCAGADLESGGDTFDWSKRAGGDAVLGDAGAEVPRDGGGRLSLRDLPLHQAGDRRDQRAGRGRRRDDDAADGRAAGGRERAHGLRVHPPRDRARGGVELVPAAGGGDLAGDGVGCDRARVRRRGGAARPARAQRAPRRRAAARGLRAGARDRGQHRAGVGGAGAAADVAHARRLAPDGGAPGGLAGDVRARARPPTCARGSSRSSRSATRCSPTASATACRRSCRAGRSRSSASSGRRRGARREPSARRGGSTASSAAPRRASSSPSSSTGWPWVTSTRSGCSSSSGLSVGMKRSRYQRVRRSPSSGSSQTRSRPPVSITASPNTSAACDGSQSGCSVRRGLPIAWACAPPGSSLSGVIAWKPARRVEPARTGLVAPDRAALAVLAPQPLGVAHVVGHRDQNRDLRRRRRCRRSARAPAPGPAAAADRSRAHGRPPSARRTRPRLRSPPDAIRGAAPSSARCRRRSAREGRPCSSMVTAEADWLVMAPSIGASASTGRHRRSPGQATCQASAPPSPQAPCPSRLPRSARR